MRLNDGAGGGLRRKENRNPIMEERIQYEYDETCQVMIRVSSEESPKIMEETNPVWRELGKEDDMYARAIYMGQGCWEDLRTITAEEAEEVLHRWGVSLDGAPYPKP